ncbi:MAG: hypothetical protein KKH83_01490 [Candidatus Margulisbacteria bacterium]|nr:hypothetical protein [Candidatus Margulisiibacteriota bacterium]
MFVSKQEMASLDEGERIGLYLGDCVFIEGGTPADYVPLVVLNLALHRHLKEENPLSELFSRAGIDHDTSHHWTANLLDVFLAEEYFADIPERYAEYLSWRKSVERTDFFFNGTVDTILSGRNIRTRYRRITHPLDRGLYCNHSWRMSGSLDRVFGKYTADKTYRDFRVSRCDLLLRRLCKMDEFNVELTLRLLRHILEKSTTSVKNGRQTRSVVVPEEYISQADLLTKENMGEAWILAKTGSIGSYILVRQAAMSIDALINKLAFFAREVLISSAEREGDISPEILLAIKNARMVLSMPEISIQNMEIDLSSVRRSEESLQRIKAMQEILGDRINTACGVLEKFRAVEEKLNKMGEAGFSIIPGGITQDIEKIKAEIERLVTMIAKYSEAMETLSELAATREEMRGLLGVVVLDAAPAGQLIGQKDN